MPEVSLTSKRVREPEKGSKEQDNTVKKKKRETTKVTQLNSAAVSNI